MLLAPSNNSLKLIVARAILGMSVFPPSWFERVFRIVWSESGSKNLSKILPKCFWGHDSCVMYPSDLTDAFKKSKSAPKGRFAYTALEVTYLPAGLAAGRPAPEPGRVEEGAGGGGAATPDCLL